MRIIDDVKKDILKLFKVRDSKAFMKENFPYLFIFYLGNIFSAHVNLYVGGDLLDRLMQSLVDINQISFIPSLYPINLLVGLSFTAGVKALIYFKSKKAKKFRQGKEYGSARWGTEKDIEPYRDEVFENNLILTNTEWITMNSRPKNPKYARNKNVLVIGGSGSGKTRFFVKPNIMQLNTSMVITDPKGLTY